MKRAPLAERVLVVGNLIGAATVEAVPQGQRPAAVRQRPASAIRCGAARSIAKVEDREIQEQVRQAEAAYQVVEATIRQREADLKLAQTNLDRNRSLLERQLLPQQTFDDTEARHQAARRAARSRPRAVRAGEGAARRAEDQPGEHRHLLAGRRLRRQALPRSGRVGQPQRAGRLGGGHPPRPHGGERRREGREARDRRHAARRSRSMRSRARSSPAG